MWAASRRTSRRLLHGRKARHSGSAANEGLLECLAVDYQHRYRSSYLFVLLAGALALAASTLDLAFHEPRWTGLVATGTEFVALSVIAGLVFWNRLRRWQERYILYRMLRESFRQFEFLHALGWSPPVTPLARGRGSRRSWVPWLFSAIARSRPLRRGTFDSKGLADIQRGIGTELLGGQVAFHERRREECSAAAHVLGLAGKGLFLATLGSVFAKMLVVSGAWGAPHGPAHLAGPVRSVAASGVGGILRHPRL